MKQAENHIAHLKFDDDVLYVVIKENVDLGIKELEELLGFANNLTNFQKRYTIVDTRTIFNSSHDISNFYAKSDNNKYRYADAFIVNSLAMRLLVNFYIRFHKPKIPTRLFNDEQSAINWINSLKKEQILVK